MDCSRIKTNGERCERPAFVNGVCHFHDALDRAKQRKNLTKEAWAQILEALWTFQDTAKAYSIFAETLEHLTPKEAMAFRWKCQAEAFRYTRDTDQLCVIASYRQNAHCRAVGNQTERTLALLRKLERPFDRNVPGEIMDAWLLEDRVPGEKMIPVGQDLHKWYTTEPRYAELLDLLWVYIQESPAKDELVFRLYQEVSDGQKKCRTGVLARLCNVLVGFDDRFNPPTTPNEVLQHKMAVISQKPLSVEYKVGEAWKVFEELNTPMEEREAWIREF